MRHWLKLIRWQEWFDTKLPLIVMISYYSITKQPHYSIWVSTIRIALYGAGLLAFGYVINDISDEVPDRLAGKKRGVHRLTHSQSWLVVAINILILPIALYPYLLYQPLKIGFGLVFSLIIAAAYSVKPFRLKERGWLGLVAASAAQRSIPAFVAAMCLDILDPVTWAMILVYFLNGLRYIVMHQVIDEKNDRITNVQTYMLSGDRLSTGSNYLSILLSIELIVLALMPIILPSGPRWIGMTSWPYFLYWIAQLIRLREKVHPLTYDKMPLQTYYFFVWPISLVFAAALSYPLAWPLLFVELIWKLRFWKPAWQKFKARKTLG